MLIISGPGRSGTSVLAVFCKEMGFDPGGTWYDPTDAGMEYPLVARINDSIINTIRRTGSYAEALEMHGEVMRTLPLKVVKDPRFTYHTGVLRAWAETRTDLSYLLTYRHPEHSVASRRRHFKALGGEMEKNRDGNKVRQEFADTLETLMELDVPHRLLLFPHFLSRYPQVWEAFTTLGLPIDREQGAAKWAQLVNPDKVHFQPPQGLAQEPEKTKKFRIWPIA